MIILKVGHKSKKVENNKTLLVVPCLIGEFAAAVPAIFDYIERNKNKSVDLLVTPALLDLAGSIRGVNNVYVTKSVYGREFGYVSHNEKVFGDYYEILVLRASQKAYLLIKNINAEKLTTALFFMIRQSLNLWKSLIFRTQPKNWRTVNFEILGGKESEIDFEKMINISDDKNTEVESVIDNQKKNIMIHTGVNWPMKHWPKENWLELIKAINKLDSYNFIFVGAKEDVEDFNYISSNLDFNCNSLISKTGILQLVKVMSKSDYFIGIDSGPANLAHLVGLRSITIFGPGPHMFMPTNPKDIVVDKSEGKGFVQMYFVKETGFINKITPNEVFQAFNHLIKNV